MLDEGFKVFSWDAKALHDCKRLRALNLIEVDTNLFVYCVHKKDGDFKNLSSSESQCRGRIVVDDDAEERGWVQCSDCGRTVFLEDKKTKETVYTIHLKPIEIQRFIEEKLKAVCDLVEAEKREMFWRIECDGKQLLAALLDFLPRVSLIHYQHENPDSFITFVWSSYLFNILQRTHANWHLCPFETFLEEPEVLRRELEVAGAQPPSVSIVNQCAADFERLVKSLKPSGRDFEEFCFHFCKQVSSNPTNVKKFLAYLEKDRFLLRKTILLGGAGRPDSIQIPLFEYLTQFFTFVPTIECKGYDTSKLTVDRFSKATFHAETIGQDSVLVITSTNNVQPEIWISILTIRNQKGEFTRILIDRDLFIFLLVGLGFENLPAQWIEQH